MNREINQLERIIEGALFTAGEPLPIDKILQLFDESQRPEKQQIKEALQNLIADYNANRGIELKELASGFQFQIKPDLAQWVLRLWEERPARYSRAMLETLSLIAYRQPITRGEIEEIRGVAVSSQMVRTLLDRGWIRLVGYREVPGRPGLYATTKQFLDYFGLKNLNELPTLAEIQAEVADMPQEVELGSEENEAVRQQEVVSTDNI
jgi:segregation and condensation protein B